MAGNTHTFGLPLSLANSAGVQPQIEKGTGDPNGVLTRPIGSLFLRTDVAQLWQNANGGTTWVQSGGAGTVPNPTPNDYFIELGASSGMGLGYFLAATTGLPADTVALGAGLPVPFPVSGNSYLPWIRVSTQNATYTGPGTGGSGWAFFGTGDADAAAGSTGGTTGYILISSGSFSDGAGTSGASGFVEIRSGSSQSDTSGQVTIKSGDSSLDRSGDLRLETGAAGTQAGDVVLEGGAGASGGSIQITGGSSSGGAGGNVVLAGGNGTTNKGEVQFDSGIQPSPSDDSLPSYNDALAYGFFKARCYIVGTGPGVVTRQYVVRFKGEIEMVLVRNANVGAGDTLAITINGTNVLAPGGAPGPITQAGGTLISGDQFLPRLNGAGTLFDVGDTILVAYNAAGLSGGAMISIAVRRRV